VNALVSSVLVHGRIRWFGRNFGSSVHNASKNGTCFIYRCRRLECVKLRTSRLIRPLSATTMLRDAVSSPRSILQYVKPSALVYIHI